MKCIMNDASRNTVKRNSPLNIASFEVTQSFLLLGVAATFEKSSRGQSIVTVENRWSRKNDKNFIPKIIILGLLVTSLSEYIRHNRKLSITFNFRFNIYDKKIWKAWRHMILTLPPSCHTFLDPIPPPRAWRTLWTAPVSDHNKLQNC